jgi:activator of 2-hydroxyglutaryl-CoA dehydratase/predicted nucleotide-binding protein (sugar kinase/HSP70/actin superfamily)
VNRPLVIGLDVGSTTCKAVLLDGAWGAVRWKRYLRHRGRQEQAVQTLLSELGSRFPDVERGDVAIHATGSGSGALLAPLGAAFVHEVAAVTLAARQRHRQAGCLVELGGQDSKLVILGDATRPSHSAMNERCAAGTGATIERCLLKLGLDLEQAAALDYRPDSPYAVAARCGVFAETDLVNLLKRGVAAEDLVSALARAIVAQNLELLARGRLLPERVLLLGGPNVFLPWLRQCWQHQLPLLWRQGGYQPPDLAIQQLVFCPADAEYFAAIGAALSCRNEAAAPVYRGLQNLRHHLELKLTAPTTERHPALVGCREELEAFDREFPPPRFHPPPLQPGRPVAYWLGLDGGSTSSKAVLLNAALEPLAKAYRISQGNPIDDLRALLAQLAWQLRAAGGVPAVRGAGVTGYAADLLGRCIEADAMPVETVAHMEGALRWFPAADVVCDIGGQDIKLLFLRNGTIRDFKLSNQCSAGNGMLLQAVADQLGIALEDYAQVAFGARGAPPFDHGCAVFLDAERVNFQRLGYTREEMLAGFAQVLPKNIWEQVVQTRDLARFGTRYVLQGGTQYNRAALKAQVDYIRARVSGAEVHLHPHPGEAGAIGAAVAAARSVEERGRSRFIGLQAALGLSHRSPREPVPPCQACPNHCTRSAIVVQRPDGSELRLLSGQGCEAGAAEAAAEVRRSRERRREQRGAVPNLAQFQAHLAFARIYRPEALPADASPWPGQVRRGWGLLPRVGFRRSGAAAARRRTQLRVAMPRALNLFSLAPWFRAYFETLGLPPANILFSRRPDPELLRDAAGLAGTEGCHPAQLARAHVYELLQRPPVVADWLFFPCVTHLPTWIDPVLDSTACPVAAGAPQLIRADLSRETDLFASHGLEYLCPALQFTEPHYLQRQMHEVWGERLGISPDENAFACVQGWRALDAVQQELQRRGVDLLRHCAEDGVNAVLALCRPYQLDPQVNHRAFETLQSLGHPVLTIDALPRDPAFLKRYLGEAPMDLRPVWPETFATHSMHKVWGARLAAAHPHLAALELSSFRCGQDAPTYSLIDAVLAAGDTPLGTLHDLDANDPHTSLALRLRTFAYRLGKQIAPPRERTSTRERAS